MSNSSAGYTKRRYPTVAGIFYPEEAKEVEAALERFEGEASGGEKSGTASAIIAPHAGWDLSGKVAADAFRAASGREISTVLMIGPLHQDRSEGLFLSESEYFETPIGDLPVDRELCAELESCGTFFVTNDIPHLEEHSIEILLPFIKRYFPKASIVPVLVGGSRTSIVRTLASAIDLVFAPIADSTLIVVSTNLCGSLAAEIADAHAARFREYLDRADHAAMLESVRSGEISACGAAGCAALMATALFHDRRAVALSSSDSAERPDHDPSKKVRYGSFAYF